MSIYSKIALAVAIVGLGPIGSVLHGQSIYTAGHGDLGVEYTPGSNTFEAHWHIGSGAVIDGQTTTASAEFEPGDIIASLQGSSNVSNSAVAAALGLSEGSSAFRTGTNAYPPNLGFGLEEVGSPSDWLGESITLTLTGFSGPGQMAISQTVSGLGTFVWFSSLDAATTQDNNAWSFGVGGHQHNDWWFSEEGLYSITFTWSGTYLDGEASTDVSGTGTFNFQVGNIPEPAFASVWLGAVALIPLISRRRAQKR